MIPVIPIVAIVLYCLPLNGPKYEGKSIRYWIKQLGVDAEDKRYRAWETLFENVDNEAVPYLLEGFAIERPAWVKLYLKAYVSLPPSVRTKLPLPKGNRNIQVSSMAILKSLLKTDPDQTPETIELISDLTQHKNATIRLDATRMYLMLNLTAEEQLRILFAALNDQSKMLRRYAFGTLPNMNWDKNTIIKKIVPELLHKVEDSQYLNRTDALLNLNRFSKHASGAILNLQNLLDSEATSPILNQHIDDTLSKIRQWQINDMETSEPSTLIGPLPE